MTEACTPPAGTPEETWHRLVRSTYGVQQVLYMEWRGAGWGGRNEWVDAEILASQDWRYHSAVPEPDEVEALRKVVLTLWRAEEPGGIFPAMKAAGLLDPTADYAQFSLTPLGRRALGVEG